MPTTGSARTETELHPKSSNDRPPGTRNNCDKSQRRCGRAVIDKSCSEGEAVNRVWNIIIGCGDWQKKTENINAVVWMPLSWYNTVMPGDRSRFFFSWALHIHINSRLNKARFYLWDDQNSQVFGCRRVRASWESTPGAKHRNVTSQKSHPDTKHWGIFHGLKHDV